MMRRSRVTSLRPLLFYNKLSLERSKLWSPIPTDGLRTYASQTSTPGASGTSRRQVTVTTDDGRVQWRELSRGEKAARATQQTFNFGLIVSGIVMPVRAPEDCIKQNKRAYARQGGVIYILYTEVFSSDSKTRHFNRAVDRVRVDIRALELLGSGHKIRAFGERTWNRWILSRPIT